MISDLGQLLKDKLSKTVFQHDKGLIKILHNKGCLFEYKISDPDNALDCLWRPIGYDELYNLDVLLVHHNYVFRHELKSTTRYYHVNKKCVIEVSQYDTSVKPNIWVRSEGNEVVDAGPFYE